MLEINEQKQAYFESCSKDKVKAKNSVAEKVGSHAAAKGGIHVKEKKVPALEKYMLQMGFSHDKIRQLDEALNRLGAETGFNMKEENANGSKLDLLRKIEVKFNELVEQREMALHFDARKIVEKEENDRKKKLKLKIKEEHKQAEMELNEKKKQQMIKKEEKFKKAGLDAGRNVA